MALIEQIYQSVLTGNITSAPEQVQQALDEGLDAADIMNNGLITAMNEVGSLFESGKYFIPEMLLAASTMQTCVPLLKPKLLEADVKPVAKFVIGTVKGDLHDIGKNLVAMMMEGAGFEIIDLGTDVPPEKYVSAIRESQAEFVGMSALLTTTMSAIGSTIEAITEAGLRDNVKIMIGGAPVSQEFANEVGADIYSPDCAAAAREARKFIHA